jgi:hypothetical protein
MDNFELYLYIILGVIYLVSRLLKGKSEAQKPRKSRRPQAEGGEEEKPFSFEDLFKEFEQQAPAEETPRKETAKPTFVKPGDSDYRREAEKQEEELSWAARRDEAAKDYKTYEGKSYEKYDLKKDLSNMGSLLKEDHAKKDKKVETNYYINLFKKSNGARDAFVMSEIFNKKY